MAVQSVLAISVVWSLIGALFAIEHFPATLIGLWSLLAKVDMPLKVDRLENRLVTVGAFL